MYILDTDHLSLIQRNGQEGKRILARLSAVENPAKEPHIQTTPILHPFKITHRHATGINQNDCDTHYR